MVDGKESPVKSKLSEVRNKKGSVQSKTFKTPISIADNSPTSSPLFSEQSKTKSTKNAKEKTATSMEDKTPYEADETDTNEVLTLSTGLLFSFLS